MNLQQEKIYNYLLDSVADGIFKKDDRIPTENELGQIFNTNRMNAHFAIKELERSGILWRNKRQGTFVKNIPSMFSVGKFKRKTVRRVCVLNQLSSEIRHIHFNEKILSPLESLLNSVAIEIQYKDISGIKNVGEYRRLLAELMEQGCNALILVSDGSGEGIAFDHPELLSDFHSNVFVFDPGQAIWQNMPCNVVTVNIFGEGLLAADYLISKGCRNIIFCRRKNLERIWLRERFRGMECSFRRNGFDHAPKTAELGPKGENAVFFRKLLKCRADGTAVVAMNDSLAVEMIEEAAEHGIIFGKDVPLVSFDDNKEYLSYGLTTIAPPLGKIGECLARMVMDNIDKESIDQIVCMKVESSLIKRNTA